MGVCYGFTCMLDSGWLHLSSLGPWGSKVTNCKALSFFTFSRQHCDHANEGNEVNEINEINERRAWRES